MPPQAADWEPRERSRVLTGRPPSLPMGAEHRPGLGRPGPLSVSSPPLSPVSALNCLPLHAQSLSGKRGRVSGSVGVPHARPSRGPDHSRFLSAAPTQAGRAAGSSLTWILGPHWESGQEIAPGSEAKRATG